MIHRPYHEGELTIQKRAKVSHSSLVNSALIRETIMKSALSFIQQQVMIIIGSIDTQGEVWASVLFGHPGFTQALNSRTVKISISTNSFVEADPLQRNLKLDAPLGLLFIEATSRRRLRINGHVNKLNSSEINLSVERAYPNCPKYIHRRHWQAAENKPDSKKQQGITAHGHELNESSIEIIENSDTFFVASAHPTHGLDASHRGGHLGFVYVVDSKKLRIPDFSGNNMFNTLGNFESYPHAGLIFINFTNGRLLQLSGMPKILWDYDDPHNESGGSNRYWEFTINQWRSSYIPEHFTLLYKSEYLDSSPYIPVLKK